MILTKKSNKSVSRNHMTMSENPNEKYFVVNICMIERNGIGVVANISIQFDIGPRPELEVSMSGLTSHSQNDQVYFPLDKDYVRYNPKESFQNCFVIMTKDQVIVFMNLMKYIHESKEKENSIASLSLMGSSKRRV